MADFGLGLEGKRIRKRPSGKAGRRGATGSLPCAGRSSRAQGEIVSALHFFATINVLLMLFVNVAEMW